MPRSFTFSSPLQIAAVGLVPVTALADLRLAGNFSLARYQLPAVVPGAGTSRHIVFARESLFAGGKSVIPLGTSGLLEETWGTVLDTGEDDTGDVQVETDDWGTVLAVGLTAARAEINLRVRTLINLPVPRRGRICRFRGRTFVVLNVSRISKAGRVREISVQAARWDDLGGQTIEAVQAVLNGWVA